MDPIEVKLYELKKLYKQAPIVFSDLNGVFIADNKEDLHLVNQSCIWHASIHRDPPELDYDKVYTYSASSTYASPSLFKPSYQEVTQNLPQKYENTVVGFEVVEGSPQVSGEVHTFEVKAYLKNKNTEINSTDEYKDQEYKVISAKTDTGKHVYLDFDHASGGYPYWSTFSGKRFTDDVFEYVNSIKRDFKRRTGEYFQKHIEPDTITVITFGAVSCERIDITSETVEEQSFMLGKLEK